MPLWEVLPDSEHTDYDMFEGAIIKADTQEEAETLATTLNYETNYHSDGSSTRQIWSATLIDIDNIPNGFIWKDFMPG